MPHPHPILFVGHGSPMNAIADNAWSQAWRALGRRIAPPKAVLCVSAHWIGGNTRVGSHPRPETIHDFGGFPDALYAAQYAAPGSPEWAERVLAVLDPAVGATLDPQRGLDHGVWQVLMHLFPQADVPVVPLGMDMRLDGRQHLAIGRMLGSLRDEGVLIVASGNIVHNLRRFDPRAPTAEPWALRFRDRINRLIVAGDFAALADFHALPDIALAAPTPEHFIPLLYALGGARPDDALHLFNDDVVGTLSMTSLVIGHLCEDVAA